MKAERSSFITRRETMTSRERILKTLNREPTDRMPIDLGVHYSTGISAFAYQNLRRYLGLQTDHIWIPDMVQFLAFVDADILTRFHGDCMLLHPGWRTTTKWNPRGNYEFEIPSTAIPEKNERGDYVIQGTLPHGVAGSMRMPQDGYFFDGDWLSDWHDYPKDTVLDLTAKAAERLHKETDYATMYMGEISMFLGGIPRAVDMLTDPEKVKGENALMCDTYLKTLGTLFDRMGGYVQMIGFADDFGVQNGPLCHPDMIESCCGPYARKLCRFIHEHSDWKVFLHSCGSVSSLIPMFIDWGIDILNPVQISAAHMDPRELKQRFGDKIIFWGGGCDTQNVLGTASPDTLSEHVKNLVSIFKPGGGYVFNPVHNIMGNIVPENIVAMYDAAYEAAFYDPLTV